MSAELTVPPAIEGASDAPAPPKHSSFLPGVWKAVVFSWKYLVGVLLCQGLLGSVLVVGWTYRLMQRSVLKRWWRRSDQRKSGGTFSEYLNSYDARHRHRHWPNWFVQQNFLQARQSEPETGGWKYARQLLKAYSHSLGSNLITGLQGIFNTWVLTLPGCVLWLFAWYDGWNNSFSKGYEQAPIGPLTGLLGIALFIAAMLYVPLAQARQAATGQWRSFYQFRLVWGLARQRWLACLGLAMIYAAVSVPVTILKTAPGFMQNNASVAALAANQAILEYLIRYFFWATFAVFPAYVLLRLLAARIYASAILNGIQNGTVPVLALAENERDELQRLNLIQVNPPRSRHVLVHVATTTGSWVLRAGAIGAAAVVWFAFVAQIFISEFLLYHPVIGWLNQPLVQLPWFHYLPLSIRHPGPEILMAVILLLTLFAVRLGAQLVKQVFPPSRPL